MMRKAEQAGTHKCELQGPRVAFVASDLDTGCLAEVRILHHRAKYIYLALRVGEGEGKSQKGGIVAGPHAMKITSNVCDPQKEWLLHFAL